MDNKYLTDHDQNLYQHIINQMPIGYALNEAVFDENNNVVDWKVLDDNSVLRTLLPYPNETELGILISEFAVNFERLIEVWQKHLNRLFSHKEPIIFEYYIPPINKWMLVKLIRLDDKQFVAYFIDQTKERQQLEEIRDNRDNIANIIEGTNVGTWEYHVQTSFVKFNERWAGILGYTLEELEPVSLKTWEDLTHPLDLELANNALQAAFNKETEFYRIEIRMKHKDGHWVWILDRGKVVSWDDDGKPLKMFGTHTDISDFRNMLETIKANEDRYRRLLDHLGAGVIIFDIEGGTSSNNKRAEDILGEEMIRKIGHLEQDKEWTFYNESEESIEFNQSITEGVYRISGPLHNHIVGVKKQKDQSIVWLSINVVPNYDNQGLVSEIILSFIDITERKEAEKAFLEAEWKFRALFEKGPIGVAYHKMIYDEDHKPLDYYFIDANQAYQKLTGVNPVGKLVTEAFPGIENDPFNWIGTFGHVAATGEELRFESYLQANDQWYDVVGYQYKPDHFVAAFLNITERKKAEKALEASESRHKAMIAGISDIISILDERSYFTYVSPNITKVFGWLPEELENLDAYMIIHPEDVPAQTDLFLKLLQGEIENLTTEFRCLCKDGSYKMVELNASNELDNPNIHGILVNYKDITERQEAEKSIAEEKERLSVTLRSIADGVITVSNDEQILIMNQVAEKLTGWTSEHAVGKHIGEIFEIVDQHSKKRLNTLTEETIRTGHIVQVDKGILLKDMSGNQRIIASSSAPIRDYDSHIVGAVLVFRDITKEQKMLQNMQRIDKLDALGILAGGIAHDFNNLLGGIFGYIDIAKNFSGDNEKVTNYLDKALSVFNRAKDLTQQLLTFSKGGVPVRETGDLGFFVVETTTFVLSGTNVDVRYDIEEGLWLCDYDENQIGQVIDNILINDLQAMPSGGKVHILVSNIALGLDNHQALKPGRYLKIQVRDNGPGIPDDVIKHIFDPFFSTKASGNGLGLATCYSIIEKHEGAIEVESDLGQGTTFTLYLPASEKCSVATVEEAQKTHRGEGSILIMDDESFMCEILSNMLGNMGYDVLVAYNGKETLKMAKEALDQQVNLVGAIFDLTIPGGEGGKEILGEFKSLLPDIPVFASSGFSEKPTIAKPKEFGFTDSIRKPFMATELAMMLEKHMH